MKNDFETDTRYVHEAGFSARVGVLLHVSIFLTGFFSLAGVLFFVRSIMTSAWSQMGMNAFAAKSLCFLCGFCAFVALVKIALDEKPFSGTLTVCVRIIGGILLAASVVFPRLPGYQSSGFEIFSSGSFVLIDGMILLPGLLLLLLSELIRAGAQMQKEMDEIL